MVVEKTSQNKTQCLLRLWSMTTFLCSPGSPCVRAALLFVPILRFDKFLEMCARENGEMPIDEDPALFVQNYFMISNLNF